MVSSVQDVVVITQSFVILIIEMKNSRAITVGNVKGSGRKVEIYATCLPDPVDEKIKNIK